ncbi:tetratricopeptide repeat protein [Mucisphaera sp.]|uniref:tetratricopeptide repeat protein n=1 Tax=Mucisphaera sp. TaxID=2913024 RepID=UPI003D0CB592
MPRPAAQAILALTLAACLALPGCSEDTPDPQTTPAQPQLTEEEAVISIATQEQRLLDAINQGTLTAQLQKDIHQLANRLPDDPSAQSLVARMHLAAGRAQRAYAAALKSLELAPDQAELRLLVATIALELNKNQLALDDLQLVLNQRPEDTKTLLLYGTASLRLGQLSQADNAYLQAIALDPTNHRGHGGRSAVALEQDDPAAALRHLRTAMDLTDDLAEPQTWRAYTIRKARILRSLGRPADAAAELRQLPVDQLAHHEASREYALALADAGSPADAARHFQQLALVLPEDATLAAETARWLARAGDTRNAQTWLDRARSLNPQLDILPEIQTEIDQPNPTPNP